MNTYVSKDKNTMSIISDILNKYITEAKSGDTTKSKKGKEVSVESGARGRERVKVGDKSYGADDKYTVKIKGKDGEVKEKTKRKAAGYTKYVDKVKEADKSKVRNVKDEAKEKEKAENAGKRKGGRKAEKKWWQDEEEFQKVMRVSSSAKKKTQDAIEAIREGDRKKEKEKEKKETKVKKVAESIYPTDPKAISQIVNEYFNPEQEEVRKYFN